MKGYNQLRAIGIVLAMVLLLTGCGRAETASHAPGQHGPGEWKAAFERQHFTLSPASIWSFYRVSSAEEQAGYQLNGDDRLFLYRFDSPEARHAGLQQIERQTATIDLAYAPYVYEVADNMVIYMARKRSPELETRIFAAIRDGSGMGDGKGQSAVARQDDFTFTLYTDRRNYKVGEPIRIWTTLVYTGSQPSVEISHEADFVRYGIDQQDGPLKLPGVMDQPLLHSVLKKGEPVRRDYPKTFAYDGNDPNRGIYERIGKEKDLKLPQGTYVISAVAEFGLVNGKNSDPNQEVRYHLPLRLTIKVTD